MQKATVFDRIRKRRKLFVYAPGGEAPIRVSLKGIALLCAIDTGMIQETSDGG